MKPKLINRLLLAPAGLWFLAMLVLPLLVVLVFSFGERGAGRRLCAGLYLRAVSKPSRTLESVRKHADPCADWHCCCAADCLSAGLFSGPARQPEMAHVAADIGDCAVLDLYPHPQLCLDFHSWRSGNSRAAVYGWPWRHKADQHKFRGVSGHRLWLSAADGLCDFFNLERLDKRLLEASADLGSPPPVSLSPPVQPFWPPSSARWPLWRCKG